MARVLVEPVPALCAEAALERPDAHVVNCALVPSDFPEQSVTVHVAGLFSLVPGARGSQEQDDEWLETGAGLRWEEPYDVVVPARPLGAILTELEAPRADLLSLDVEGYEGEVLRGLDLRDQAPRFVLLETRSDEARARAEAVFGDRYDVVGAVSPYDTLYRLRADPSGPADA